MTPERFAELAQAWGARPARWPEAERADALALLHRTPMLQAVLDREAALDTLLDTHTVAPPGAALQDALQDALQAARIAAARPRSPRARRPGSLAAWWSGAGVAGVGLAGAALGALAVSFALGAALPAARPALEAGWAATAFDAGAPAGAGNEGIDE